MSVDKYARAQQVATRNTTAGDNQGGPEQLRLEPARIVGGDASTGYDVEQLADDGEPIKTFPTVFPLGNATLAHLPGRSHPVLLSGTGGGGEVVSAVGCFSEFTS